MIQDQSKEERALLAKANKIFPGGVLGRHFLPEKYSMVFSHGKGAHLFDHSGREYIDYSCGGGALLLGYDNREIVDAINRQLNRATNFLSILNESAIEYAAELLEVIPCGELIRFSSSGSDATFFSLRLARAFTGRNRILKFEGGYHGNHDYAMWSYKGYRPSPKTDYPVPAADTAGIPDGIGDNILVAPYNDIDMTERIIREYQSDIAAVIVEPLQRLIPPADGFLERLRKLTKENNIILIFDEAVTGFRLALGGAHERFGIVPDLAVYAKTLGGGLPLGAVTGKREIMELCSPHNKTKSDAVYFSGTLYGNPVCVSAGRAFLRALRQDGVFESFLEKAERLKAGLREIIKRKGLEAEVLGIGPLWHLVFTDHPITDYQSSLTVDKESTLKFHYRLLDNGIFVRPGGGHFFSAAHTNRDVDRTLEVVDKIL